MSKQVNRTANGTNVNCPKRLNVFEKSPRIFEEGVSKSLRLRRAETVHERVGEYGKCERDQYGTEIWFHRNFRDDGKWGEDDEPRRSGLFFVRVSGECFLWSREMLRHENQR